MSLVPIKYTRYLFLKPLLRKYFVFMYIKKIDQISFDEKAG